MDNIKALVLSSGGIDSTTCVALAIKKHGKANVSTLSIFYGQKHSIELSKAKEIAEFYGVPHYNLDLSEIYKYAQNPLLSHSKIMVPEKSYADQIRENGTGRVVTYIPFRNGLFLSAAAAMAESLYPAEKCYIYYGAHADDAAGDAYADCSEDFAQHINDAITIGTYGLKQVIAPLVGLNKTQVVELGLLLNAPYEHTWSCYNGQDVPCGKCATCIDRIAAFKANGVKDPLHYPKK